VAENDEKRREEKRRRFARVNIALAVLITIATALGLAKWLLVPAIKNPLTTASSKDTVALNISGAVMNPGSYRLPAEYTLHELVIMAGGYADGADVEAVNLSTPIKSVQGDVVIPFAIPPKPPEKPPEPGEVKFPLNINEATALELQALPGIGPALAQRIINFRKEHGPFKKTSELMNVEGVGEKVYKNLFGLITVGEGLPWEQGPQGES